VMDFRLLGPLVLVVGGRPIPLGPKQRVLLLALLLAGGRYVSSARLAELLWDSGARERSSATLRSHVAHLRRSLEEIAGGEGPREGVSGHPLHTERMGGGVAYALRVDREQVDATRFQRLVAVGREQLGQARFSEAAASLADALALWRGQPLADVADRPFAAGEAKRLEALHRLAWIARVEVEVHLGRHGEVTGELEAMLACWPDDAGVRQLLAVCLHRASRTAEAARVCREGIALGVGEGLDVSILEALQRDLLRPAAGQGARLSTSGEDPRSRLLSAARLTHVS
jgi:DNA-binding SARP family transcriptional activator